jgi:GAF domain-containing protein
LNVILRLLLPSSSAARVRPFTDKQIALVTSFAAQAVIAIENARLLNELRQRTNDLTESLEQQTATAEVLKVISSSPGHLEPVFAAILENATRICGAKLGSLNLCEEDRFRVVAMHGVERVLKAKLQNRLLRLAPNSALGRLSRAKKITHIPDVRSEPGFFETPPGFDGPYLALEAGARTLIAVPMLKENELIGGILIYREEVQPFTEKQIGLVASFAAQAVIAIENARLLSELRQRTSELGRSVEELRALGDVSQAVNSTLELETVLDTIVAKAVQLTSTEAGAIYVLDDRLREFRLRATYGMDRELIAALTRYHIGLDEPNVVAALAQSEPIQVADLQEETHSDLNEITLRAGYRARLVAPLIRGEHVVGLLVVRRRKPGAFPQDTVDLIKTFAAQSTVAIENARLFKSVEASLEDLRTAQDRLVQTQKLASLGQLTAGIAHEIKNPLNFVNNFSGVSAELLDELREALAGVKADHKTRAEINELADTLRDNLERSAIRRFP